MLVVGRVMLQLTLLTLLSEHSHLLAVYPSSLIVLFCDLQYGKLSRHDPARNSTRHNTILREVRDTLFAKKVFVQVDEAVDLGCGSVDHGEDGIGEDCLRGC
jgi:hypothetical protein